MVTVRIIIMLRNLLRRGYMKVLNKDTIGQNVKNTEYAIRGAIVQRADELTAQLVKKEKLPFSKLLACNIGNPLSLGQPTFTFDREVISASMNINLLHSNDISADAKRRAKAFVESVEYPHALGAYTASAGLPIVRNSIKRYIEERDGYPCDTNNLFLTNGASDGVTTIFQTLLGEPRDAVFSTFLFFIGHDSSPSVSTLQRPDFALERNSSSLLPRREQGLGPRCIINTHHSYIDA